MLQSVTHGLQIILVVLRHGGVGPENVSLRNAVCAVVRQGVSGHTAVDDTGAGQTGDIRDTWEGSAVLADLRERRQGEHASTT